MAIFHSTMKIIGRSQGRSAVGSAAYRAGEMMTNEYDGMTHDYTRKGGIVYSEIMLPINAPIEFYNRSKLWNAVELSEKRCDSQTARENEIALPVELNRKDQIELVRDYIHQNFVDKGMCADFTLHDKGDGNPHAHIMLTTRIVDEYGFGKKERSWNGKANVEQWRQSWADICNQRLRENGFEATLDPRSYKEQGIEKVPSIHMGRAFQLEKHGIITNKGNENLTIKQKNFEILEIQRRLNEIERELKELSPEPEELTKWETSTPAAAYESPAAPEPEELTEWETSTPPAAPEQQLTKSRSRLPGESLVQYIERLRVLSEERRLQNPKSDRSKIRHEAVSIEDCKKSTENVKRRR